MTQNDLGNTFRTLAEKQSDPAPAHKAIAAYEAALTVFIEANATYFIEIATQNLAAARALLTRLEAPR